MAVSPDPTSPRRSLADRFDSRRTKTAVVVSGVALAVGLVATTAVGAFAADGAEVPATTTTAPLTVTTDAPGTTVTIVEAPTTTAPPSSTKAPTTKAPTTKPPITKAPTTTTKPSTTTTTTPAPVEITYSDETPNGPTALRGDGLGVAKLGEDAEVALGKMVKAWGKPNSDGGWWDAGLGYEVRTVYWGDHLYTEFERSGGTSRFVGASVSSGGVDHDPNLITSTGVNLSDMPIWTQADFAPMDAPSYSVENHYGARCITDHGQPMCAYSERTWSEDGSTMLPVKGDEILWQISIGITRFNGHCGL